MKIIKENVGKMIYDPETGENRPIQYKDIVILSRKLSGLTDYMAQIFSANGIPYTIERAGVHIHRDNRIVIASSMNQSIILSIRNFL